MKNANFLLFGSVILILLAVGLVAILDRTSPSSQSSDVRARAGSTYTLKLLGIVEAINETKGTIEVSSVQFAPESRSGNAQDLGNWIVSVPANFNFGSVSVGSRVTIGVDAKTFQVTSHKLTAVTLVPAK